MKKLLFILLLLISTCQIFAGKVDSVSIYSHAMQTAYKAVVITPDSYENATKNYPVVYLLHGYGGWFSNWIQRVPELKEYVDTYQLIIVCPEGKNSWYIDKPNDASASFETYLGKEIPAFIDANYRTIKDRTGRAITGLSMGGHGGLYLGFRQSHIFGACGSMSGGVDIKPFSKNWEITKWLGDTTATDFSWKRFSVMDVIENKPSDSLAIIFDCGTKDFFYEVNKHLHEKMLELKIIHDYIERPGEHNWAYWQNAIPYQLMYFSRYFEKMKK